MPGTPFGLAKVTWYPMNNCVDPSHNVIQFALAAIVGHILV